MEMSRDLSTSETRRIYQESQLMPGAISCVPPGRKDTEVKPSRVLDQQSADKEDVGTGKQRYKVDTLGDEAEEQEGDLTAEERLFLDKFPDLKEQLEAGIRKLQTLADHLDVTHQALVRAGLLTSSVAVLSGALSILGLLLAPGAAGGGLLLSVAGRGLGTVAGATSVLTGVLARFHTHGVRALACSVLPRGGQGAGEARGGMASCVPSGGRASCVLAAGELAYDGASAVQEVGRLVRAVQEARACARLVKGRLVASGQQMHRAVGGSALGAAFSLGLDLLQGWRPPPREDAGLALAEELRTRAWELQRELAELMGLQERLRQQKPLGGERPTNSSSKGATGPLPQAWQDEGQELTGEEGGILSPVTSG